MPKELRGTRYITAENRGLAEFIATELPFLDYEETMRFYVNFFKGAPDFKSRALLGCNDRYFLLTGLLQRVDLLHPWLFARCREVEAAPYGHIDLWARAHGKTSIITTGGIIQAVICDPEETISIFSVTKPLAQEILAQIKNEFETNDHLKEVYPDVFYANPRGKGPDGRPAKWSLARGITVKRKGHPKEATVEAHGLIDGQPTGRHFRKHFYDDIVTQDYLSEEQIKKTTERFEMADNLGTRLGVDKCIAGTRYHFADTLGLIIERGTAKARIYPATEDGTLGGKLVLLTPENWERIKRDQGMKTVSAQMLLNPQAGGQNTFDPTCLQPYEVIPAIMNVYILIDPSKGKGQRSDRTAFAVIGVDQGGSKYLLDGARHRMKLSERWELIKALRRKWTSYPGVQLLKIGYEQYGMLDDISVLQEMMEHERDTFEIEELSTPETGGHSKQDRIERLEPDIRNGRFYLPCTVHHPDLGLAYWSVWTEEKRKRAEKEGKKADFNIGQIIYWPAKGLTSRQVQCDRTAQKHRIVTALKRRDENSDVYDLTRAFIDEAIRHPFGAHDDLIDAVARVFDIEPSIPVVYERRSLEPLEVDFDEFSEMEEFGPAPGSMGRPF